MKQVQHLAALMTVLVASLLASGCTTTLVVMHVYDRVTEGDPTPCAKLNSVQRALQERCGPYVVGSLQTQDVASSGLPICPLTLAARDPKFWPVLPELIDKGASPETCQDSPWAALAKAQPCPDLLQASASSRQALRWLAEVDARAVQHDVVRALSCPTARAAGLDQVLDGWAAHGQLQAGQVGFGLLNALHPSHLHSPLARTLESQGHGAAAGLGSYAGSLAPGFEEALRIGDFAALDWWLDRVPALVHRGPPTGGDQLPWVPLARVLTPSFMPDPAQQHRTVEYLLSRGANPWQALPHQPSKSVMTYAQQLKSPMIELLDMPRPAVPTATAAASTMAADPQAR
jgi:hypothetical protein